MRSSPFRCLVLDDDYLVALEAEHILKQLLACSVEIRPLDALRSACVRSFDLILIGLGLTGGFVMEAIAQLIADDRTIIVATTFGEWPGGAEIIGDVPVVTRPYESEEMRQAIEEAVRLRLNRRRT